jgi:filamentous hemagglutinin
VVPHGFANAEEFSQFGSALHGGLADAGYADAQGILQGSAVTGTSFRTGAAFDVGRVSDFDVALSGDSLFQAAQDAGVGLRSAGTRTGPLSEVALQKMGIFDLSTQLSAQAGRPVNFMIYNSTTTAVSRAPSILIPR